MSEELTNGNPHPLILSGYSSQRFAGRIATALGSRIIGVKRKQHPNYEIELQFNEDENVRGHNVVVVSSAAGEPNKQEKETRLLMRAANEGGAKSVILLWTYDTYGRSDKYKHGSFPGLIDTIDTYRPHCKKVLALDPHSPNTTTSRFNSGDGNDGKCTVIHFAFPYAIQIRDMIENGYIAKGNKDKLVLGFADEGGMGRAPDGFRMCMYEVLGFPDRDPYINDWPHGAKGRHGQTNQIQILAFTGDVAGKDVVLFEDMAATSGTICDTASSLKDRGANSVTFFATKGLFTADRKKHEPPDAAVKRLDKSRVDAVFVTDVYTHADINPRIQAAMKHSPVVHALKTDKFIAAIIKATLMEVDDRTPVKANSVSAILSGQHADQRASNQNMVVPVQLKRNNPLVLAAK